MKVISWNCQMAFRKKNAKILKYKPDIVIIQECENETNLKFGELTPIPNDFLWFGDNDNKGIGIFSYSDYKFSLHENYNQNFRFIIPLIVTGVKNFNLFAVWAMNRKDDSQNKYIGQIWQAIKYYSDILDNDSLIIGDFNSNAIWDYQKLPGSGNHSDVVNHLKAKNIVSLYHTQYNEEQGKETKQTFCFRRKIETKYHIDYCFASERLVSNGFNFEIGARAWYDLSDHAPIFVDI